MDTADDPILPTYNGQVFCFNVRYRKHLQLWKLAVPRQDPGDLNTHVGSILPLSDEPLKLVEICTGDDEAIRTFGVSPDASLIAYATPTRNRVFRLTLHPSEMPVISKLESKARI